MEVQYNVVNETIGVIKEESKEDHYETKEDNFFVTGLPMDYSQASQRENENINLYSDMNKTV